MTKVQSVDQSDKTVDGEDWKARSDPAGVLKVEQRTK